MRAGFLSVLLLSSVTLPSAAGDWTVTGRVPSDRYQMVTRAERPRVLARKNGLTVTTMTDEQRRLLDHLAPREQGDGGGADLRDLVAVQFLYLESACDDADAMAIRAICEGPCNMVGLRWNEDVAHEFVTIIVDDEVIDEVPGLPPPPDGAVNGYNIFGLEAGEHTFRIEELDTGTASEVTFTVLDRQPFGDPANVSCDQGAIDEPDPEGNVTCQVRVTWGSTNTPRATSFLVFFNGNPITEVEGNFGGVIFGGAPPGEYCFDVRGSWEPPDSIGDKIYVGCRVEGTCCTLTCETQTCPPVSFLDVCQVEYGGEGGTGTVVADWVNGAAPYSDGLDFLVNGTPVLDLPNGAGGNSPTRATVGPFAPGEVTIGIQGDCGPDGTSDPREVTIEILPETPYTNPVCNVFCEFDPSAENPNDPGGEPIPTTTATWETLEPAAFIDVFVRDGAGDLFFVGTAGGGLSDITIFPTEEEDVIVLQFFRYFDTGCYGSELIECSETENLCESPVLFVRGLCNNQGTIPQIADAVRLLQWRFAGAAPSNCLIACDADADGSIEVTDALRILLYLFQGGLPPAGWIDAATPTCERFSEDAPGAQFGCETSNPSCPDEGPAP